jgi:transcriptional regulator with XRE-family HTH domain
VLEHVGRNLRKIRRDRDLTQTQLARFARLRQQQVSAIENGLVPPRAVIDRLARVLDVHPNALIAAAPEKTASPAGSNTGNVGEVSA